MHEVMAASEFSSTCIRELHDLLVGKPPMSDALRQEFAKMIPVMAPLLASGGHPWIDIGDLVPLAGHIFEIAFSTDETAWKALL